LIEERRSIHAFAAWERGERPGQLVESLDEVAGERAGLAVADAAVVDFHDRNDIGGRGRKRVRKSALFLQPAEASA
jgi:hypothetical protein